jgi:hypothetical protein
MPRLKGKMLLLPGHPRRQEQIHALPLLSFTFETRFQNLLPEDEVHKAITSAEQFLTHMLPFLVLGDMQCDHVHIHNARAVPQMRILGDGVFLITLLTAQM